MINPEKITASVMLQMVALSTFRPLVGAEGYTLLGLDLPEGGCVSTKNPVDDDVLLATWPATAHDNAGVCAMGVDKDGAPWHAEFHITEDGFQLLRL